MFVIPDGPYEIGESIDCIADAFPEPTYFWQNMATLQIINGQTLTVTSALVGTTGFRCNANNGVGAKDLFLNITVNREYNISNINRTLRSPRVLLNSLISLKTRNGRPDLNTSKLVLITDEIQALMQQ